MGSNFLQQLEHQLEGILIPHKIDTVVQVVALRSSWIAFENRVALVQYPQWQLAILLLFDLGIGSVF